MRSAACILALACAAFAEETVESLLARLDTAEADAVPGLLTALRTAPPGREDIIEAARKLLRHEEPRVRIAALDALGHHLAGYGGAVAERALRPRKASPVVTRKSEQAVESALAWLARFQSTKERAGDGRWDCDDFMRHGPEPHLDGAGGSLYDKEVTGLALLAFLGAGYTDRGDHPYRSNVAEGLEWLLAGQEENGCLVNRDDPRYWTSQGVCTLALVEAWILTGDPRYRAAAAKAVAFLSKLPHPRGWGYPGGLVGVDTHTTCWVLSALSVARLGGIEVGSEAFETGFEWLDKMTDPNFGVAGYEFTGGICSYGPDAESDGERAGCSLRRSRFNALFTWTTTAFAVSTRMLMSGQERGFDSVRKGLKICMESPPSWGAGGEQVDMCYWAYGALAFSQFTSRDGQADGRTVTKTWVKELHSTALAHQEKNGQAAGSWIPLGTWGDAGGRVYSTAMVARALEAPYLFGDGVYRRRSLPKAHREALLELSKVRSREPPGGVRDRAIEVCKRLDALFWNR